MGDGGNHRRLLLVSAVLLFTMVAIVADFRRVRTGELLIQSDRGDLRVVITQDGRVVAGPTGNRSFVLLPGVYDIEVDGTRRARVAVVRGKREVLALP